MTDKEFSIHQLAEIREAILAVINDGCDCELGQKHLWELDAVKQQMRFVGAIQKRLTARITPDSATVSDTAARAF